MNLLRIYLQFIITGIPISALVDKINWNSIKYVDYNINKLLFVT